MPTRRLSGLPSTSHSTAWFLILQETLCETFKPWNKGRADVVEYFYGTFKHSLAYDAAMLTDSAM